MVLPEKTKPQVALANHSTFQVSINSSRLQWFSTGMRVKRLVWTAFDQVVECDGKNDDRPGRDCGPSRVDAKQHQAVLDQPDNYGSYDRTDDRTRTSGERCSADDGRGDHV